MSVKLFYTTSLTEDFKPFCKETPYLNTDIVYIQATLSDNMNLYQNVAGAVSVGFSVNTIDRSDFPTLVSKKPIRLVSKCNEYTKVVKIYRPRKYGDTAPWKVILDQVF